MKKRIVILLFIFTSFNLQSQENLKFRFEYSSKEVNEVLLDIEKKFNIKYSFIDSIIKNKKITLKRAYFTLDEIHQALYDQNQLKIIKIDERYFSIIKAIESEKPKEYQLNELFLEGFLAKGINKSNQKFVLYPQKINTLPGITDADILLSLQQLPGVKSPNETVTGLHIRGGTPDQNLILWDGIRLYHQGHLFGMISGINPSVNQTVSYYNKATNPKFGERISSIIEIKTTDVIEDKVKVKAGINALNSDLYIQLPILKNKIGLQLSGRKSYTEWFQSPTFNQIARKVFQNTDFRNFDSENQFQFQDYSAKLNFKLSSKSEVSISSIFIDNNLDYSNQDENRILNNQKMNILNYGYSLSWNHKYNDNWTQKTLLYYSLYDLNYEKRQQFDTQQFELYKKSNRIIDSGCELNFSNYFSSEWSLDYGYQLSGYDVSHFFNSSNQNLGIDLSTSELYNITHVGYAFLKFDYFNWAIHLGSRYSYFTILNNSRFEPRLFIQKKINDNWIWQSSFETRTQLISQFQENGINDLSLENYVWSLSDGENFALQSGKQYTTGLIYKNSNWIIDMDLYYKTLNGISTFNFGIANQTDATIRKGNGYTKGMDLLIQKNTATWRIWMTYTYQDSRNRFDSVNQNEYFEINSNINHAFNLSCNKKWNRFSVAMGWFLRSGKPYSLLNSDGQIVAFNTEQLKNYHRLDISTLYELNKNENFSIKIGASLNNVYNNRVIISSELQRRFSELSDFDQPRYRVENFYSLGITPNIFLRISL